MPDSSIVLDSSIIAAIFFPEPYSDWAEKIVKEHDVLYTVDTAFAEVANVAWKRIVIHGHDVDKTMSVLGDALEFISEVCEVLTTFSLYKEAIKIAVSNRMPIYDALFLAALSIKNTKLATLDKQLIRKLKLTQFWTTIIHPYEI